MGVGWGAARAVGGCNGHTWVQEVTHRATNQQMNRIVARLHQKYASLVLDDK